MAAFPVSPGPEPRGRVYAVLGPTNTGKTHLAVERMLGHASGIIGLPLRLLAREIYDRVASAQGARSVALVTGEEKIVPPNPRWFVCTVESMPLERDFEFVAVDEIQLVGDAERGHVFTDRLLRARGRAETMFLGADTVRGLIRRLVPEAEFVARTRFSRLAYAGPKKLSRLPPRSAVVAFSAAEVYGLAELVRRQRGGAAVVLGALSPRTRNAQVAMFQAGEVDFLVATDAIGMGLNMDVDHVGFAALAKFDGVGPRALTAAEIGQIAGRAGRHMNDGSFGTTAEAGPLAADLVERIEGHRFDAVTHARWRSSALDFTTLRDLLRALEAPPPLDCLARARDAEDYLSLKALAGNPDIAAIAQSPAAIRLLWQVCQIPDFRKSLHDAHVRLLGRIYLHLAGPAGVLPAEWVARQMARLDRTDGDIDTLSQRIAHIRTWTYVAHRGDWLGDAAHWQERARAIEDRLSDALHERLTQRFVDRRSAALVRKLKDVADLAVAVEADGAVVVEGEPVGRLVGLTFSPDAAATGPEGRHLRTAANRSLGVALEGRAQALTADGDEAFALDGERRLLWRGAPVARLEAGDHVLRPRLRVIGGDGLSRPARERVTARLEGWLQERIEAELGLLVRLAGADLAGAARGLAFQLVEGLGVLPRRQVAAQIASLADADRGRLKALGVRIGRVSVFLPMLLKPAATRLRCLLWAVAAGRSLPALPPPSLTSLALDDGSPADFWRVAGFGLYGRRAVRLDILERVAAEARRLAASGPFGAEATLLALLGCSKADLAPVLEGLGYRTESEGEATRFRAAARDPAAKPAKSRRRDRRIAAKRTDSPFARLRELTLG